MAWGLPTSRVVHLRSGHASQQGAEHAPHDVRLGMREYALRFARVEPDAVAVRALIDLDAVPLAGDQIVAALGALHVVRATLRIGGGLLGGRALLAHQLGITPGEVLLFVLARFLGHRPSLL